VNTQGILRKVAAMPISSWQYLTKKGVHHIGPMAQVFKQPFALGRDDKSISTIDADGVALAAIQSLNQKLQMEVGKLTREGKSKDSEINALKVRLQAIEKKLGL
jgi:trimeric autotransporter adhesin